MIEVAFNGSKNRREYRKKRLSRLSFGSWHFHNVAATIANYVCSIDTALPRGFRLWAVDRPAAIPRSFQL
jgi:hypothetical protein